MVIPCVKIIVDETLGLQFTRQTCFLLKRPRPQFVTGPIGPTYNNTNDVEVEVFAH